MPARSTKPGRRAGALHEALPKEAEFQPAVTRAPASLPEALRPRAKLLRHGARRLSASELLALVIGGAGHREPAEQLSEKLLRTHGLRGLVELGVEGWRSLDELGPATKVRLSAALELGRRAAVRRASAERIRLSRPLHVYRQLRRLAQAKKEHLIGLYLDSQNGLLHRETISIGTLNTTRSHPREILYPAITHLALGFILAHNHPSGCLDPSPEDIEFTRAVKRAGELMGIELYDHLIIGRAGYTSLRQRGLL